MIYHFSSFVGVNTHNLILSRRMTQFDVLRQAYNRAKAYTICGYDITAPAYQN